MVPRDGIEPPTPSLRMFGILIREKFDGTRARRVRFAYFSMTCALPEEGDMAVSAYE